ncbi:MAG TPA: polysaccharide deacetylase family protein [Thermoanaerobaculia bacterium]|nr:polysaccharide deacetylase family protein [Thermoanaerobaculia bacterium]
MSSVEITLLRTSGRAPRVLTIDAEEWFHVCGEDYYSDPRRWDSFPLRIDRTFLRLLDVLDHGGHRATIFFLGWIARRQPRLVTEAVARGHEVAVHGDRHRRVDEMTSDEFRSDLRQARNSIEDAGGVACSAHRAAEWSIRHPGDRALSILAEEGFRCDASATSVPPLGDAENPLGPYRISRNGTAILEFPPLTGRVLGRRLPVGGGWPFRMLSERRIADFEDAHRDRGFPAVFTFHPWEFDPDHPPMGELPPLLSAVHFAMLRRLPGRFDRWLARERCVALSDVVPSLERA